MSGSNHSDACFLSIPRKKTGGLEGTSLRLRCPPLRLPLLLRLVLLRASLLEAAAVLFWRVFGATMTSASGPTLAKGTFDGGAGVRPVTVMFAVDVGDRWRVKGWCVLVPEGGE
ncbi:hypothetical protein KEM55_007543 [Ascosphaera atra]|nr:hypothetical protein KEM55_007543 [Ascosphaera atra]